MIRINLLPQKKRRVEASSGEGWVLVAVGVLAFEIAALFFYHTTLEDQLAEEQQRNAEVQAKIDASKKAVENHSNVTNELTRLRAREEAIAKLQNARTGPTAVLLETARILTPGRGPSIDPEKLAQVRRDNPLAAFNPAWDTRRLWLLSFREESRKLRMTGVARDAEDVSEFAKRMTLSDYFDKVRLLPASRGTDGDSGLEVVNFAMEAEVKY
ncbi:MAG TPA: PilN domain-containing protein [Polyangiaceae bacterium]|nr:PilN domain-containing protein [Polyangiaceae bacterium]